MELVEVVQSTKPFDRNYMPKLVIDENVEPPGTCPWINLKGRRKGEECGLTVQYEDKYCSTHKKLIAKKNIEIKPINQVRYDQISEWIKSNLNDDDIEIFTKVLKTLKVK